jgi:hypothetical protein
MPLIQKPEMTEKNLAAHRRNARKSRGATTPGGKEQIRDANLLHGFYSQERDTALRALGENPDEFEAVVEAVREQWQPANRFQELLVLRMARAIWRLNRSDRTQEGYALRQAKDVNNSREDRLHAQMMRLKMTAASLQSLALAVAREHYVTTAADLELMKSLHPEGVMKEMGQIAIGLFYQLQEPGAPGPGETEESEHSEVDARQVLTNIRAIFGLGPLDPEPEASASSPSQEGQQEAGATEAEEEGPNLTAEEWEAREPVRQLLENILTRQVELCEAPRVANLRECLAGPSTFERAAEIAPTHGNAMLMQRMEDSSFRQVWRTTNMLLKLKRQAPGQEICEKSQASGDVNDKTGS